jgi:hypothetical protein
MEFKNNCASQPELLREVGGPLQAKEIWLLAELRRRNATDILLGKMAKDSVSFHCSPKSLASVAAGRRWLMSA